MQNIIIPSELPTDPQEKTQLLLNLKESINNYPVVENVQLKDINTIYISANDMACDPCDNIYDLLKGTKMSNNETGRFYVIPKNKIIIQSQEEVSGGSKRRIKSSKKKKGGSVPVNSQATVLQSASYAPSLDNAFLSQSTLVGGKKKRTQKKRKSLKKRSTKRK